MMAIDMGTEPITQSEAIVQTVVDYFEGWFEGDVTRMDRALHRDLVKRRVDNELGTLA